MARIKDEVVKSVQADAGATLSLIRTSASLPPDQSELSDFRYSDYIFTISSDSYPKLHLGLLAPLVEDF